MIVIAALEAPAIIAGLDDVAVVGQAVEQRGGHFGVTEDARPFTECQVGRDDNRGAFVKSADEVEQKLATGLGERQVAEFVQHDEVHACQMFGEPALASIAGLDLEPVDQIDDVVEATTGATPDAASRNGDGQMSLAGPSSADQHGIALLGKEGTAGKIWADTKELYFLK